MHAGETVVEGGVLEDQPDGMTYLVLLVNDVETVEGGLTRSGPRQRAEDIDGGGLAGAVRAGETEDLARRDVEANVVDGGELAELLYQVVDMND